MRPHARGSAVERRVLLTHRGWRGAVTPLLALALVPGCGDGAPSVRSGPPADLETSEAVQRALRSVPAVPAVDLTGPLETPFSIAARTPEVGQYPCGSCHEEGGGVRSGEPPHEDIVPVHPTAVGGSCQVCHAGGTREALVLQDGSETDLDHAYRLCGQCHFGQLRDWAGGAHGKRLGGWLGDRVVESCTGCHDPHDPAFQQRMPEGYPRIPRTGRSP